METVTVVKLDPRIHHPFTCIVSGPSQAGKSTFVKNLILNKNKYIKENFDYIFIFIGTEPEKNLELKEIADKLAPQAMIFNCQPLFQEGPKNADKYFRAFLQSTIESKSKNEKGCLIFDDLMQEMGDTNFLVDVFTKYSSHSNFSCILITQNIFHKGKNASQHITLYRNTHVLVLFESFLDSTTLNNISSRLSIKNKETKEMLREIQRKYRYVVIRGDFNTPEKIRITSDYFSKLNEGILFKCFETPNDGKL